MQELQLHIPRTLIAMTAIQEAQKAKAALEKTISETLQQFNITTGLSVTSVNVDEIKTNGETSKYLVKINVQL